MRSIFAVISLIFATITLADETNNKVFEMYMANDEGGYVTLTNTLCTIEGVKDHFQYRVYSTVATSDKVEEGCWLKPEKMADAPQGAIPVINIWHDGVVEPFLATFFSPTKEVKAAANKDTF